MLAADEDDSSRGVLFPDPVRRGTRPTTTLPNRQRVSASFIASNAASLYVRGAAIAMSDLALGGERTCERSS
jgi:hypothetical protein